MVGVIVEEVVARSADNEVVCIGVLDGWSATDENGERHAISPEGHRMTLFRDGSMVVKTRVGADLYEKIKRRMTEGRSLGFSVSGDAMVPVSRVEGGAK